MKGKKNFSENEVKEISDLIRKKLNADRDEQKKIRDKIRALGFYASDFGIRGGYTVGDFLGVIDKGDSDAFIKPWIEKYKKLIKGEYKLTNRTYNEVYKWETIQHFQDNWSDDHNASNIYQNLTSSFDKDSNNLWSNSHFLPYAVIKEFAEHEPARVSKMFHVLFDENKSLDERALFFQNEAEKLKILIIKDEKKMSYQEDRSVALYLSLRFPDKYYLYKNSMFNDFCHTTGYQKAPGRGSSSNIEILHEYFEMCDNVRDVLVKDEELLKIHRERLPDNVQLNDDHHILTQDFIYAITDYLKPGKYINKDRKWYHLAYVIKLIDNEELVRKFFAAVKIVVEHNQLDSENRKIYAASLRKYKRLHLTIGDHYMIMGDNLEGEYRFGFYSNTEYYERLQSEFPDSKKMDKRTVRGDWIGNWTEGNYEIYPIDSIEDILRKTSEKRLTLGNSSHRTHFEKLHNKWIIEAVLDEKLLEELLNEDISEYDPDANTEENDEHMSTNNKNLNQILFGPPGTGKTYCLQKEYFPKYTSTEDTLTTDQFLTQQVQSLSWWQVLGIALIQNNNLKVSDLINNPWVSKKAELSESKNVRATIWGTLQMHTINESTSVNYKLRQAPLIFDKNDDKSWKIFEDEAKETAPELFELIDSIKNFNSNSDRIIKRYEFVTFHQSYTYEDFVEGIKPVLAEDLVEQSELNYEIKPGIFKEICKRAESDPENDYALFIDEINRGNVSQIFGELITLIEGDKRKGEKNELSLILPYSRKIFSVPKNLHIIGTMNTADRSVEALDTALRRRFSFAEMPPRPELLSPGMCFVRLLWKYDDVREWDDPEYLIPENHFFNLTEPSKGIKDKRYKLWEKMEEEGRNDEKQAKEFPDNEFTGLNLKILLKTINRRLEKLIDKDHMIGHSYFMDVISKEDLISVFKDKIIPLLQEYFFGDFGKIGLVLGSSFIDSDDQDFKGFGDFDYEDSSLVEDFKTRRVYSISSPEAWDFQSIV